MLRNASKLLTGALSLLNRLGSLRIGPDGFPFRLRNLHGCRLFYTGEHTEYAGKGRVRFFDFFGGWGYQSVLRRGKGLNGRRFDDPTFDPTIAIPGFTVMVRTRASRNREHPWTVLITGGPFGNGNRYAGNLFESTQAYRDRHCPSCGQPRLWCAVNCPQGYEDDGEDA